MLSVRCSSYKDLTAPWKYMAHCLLRSDIANFVHMSLTELDLQVYSVYMQLRHKLHQLQPKIVKGFKNSQQLAQDKAKAAACPAMKKQLEEFCHQVHAVWAATSDRDLMRMGLPVLRYALALAVDSTCNYVWAQMHPPCM